MKLREILKNRRNPLLMGILNRTPDSFSDGGIYLDDSHARERMSFLVKSGAAIVDIGAESTRPGSLHVDAKEQIQRLGNLLSNAVALGVLVSIDTQSPVVAEWALRQGFQIVNSVSLEITKELASLCVRYGASLVLMHNRAIDMTDFSNYPDEAYGDVVQDVIREWLLAARSAHQCGLEKDALIFDPGIGFAKNAHHSLELCCHMEELCAVGYPVLLGPSRKSFIAKMMVESEMALPLPTERLGGTIAVCLDAARKGVAILRVHDVYDVNQALVMNHALLRRHANA